MARNIKERKVAKSMSRNVGKCFGLKEIAPVAGSMTMVWRVASEPPDTTMPFVEPGAARYCKRLGLGVWRSMEMLARLSLSRHFFTRISSCEKDHSSAEMSSTGEFLCVCDFWTDGLVGDGAGGDVDWDFEIGECAECR